MRIRKLDQILEQCIEETTQIGDNMLNLNKLSKICNEALEEDTLQKMAQDTIEEILENNPVYDFFSKATLEQIEEPVAEKEDYTVYGETGENYLVLDVKGRPDIKNPEVQEILEKHEDALLLAIEDFANLLLEEIPNFVTAGRMGGYWGLKDFDHNLVVSTRGKQIMVYQLVKLAKDNDADSYEGTLEEAEEEDRVEAFLYDLADNYLEDLMNNLLDDDEAFEIKAEYLATMKKLEQAIDSQEKTWNEPEAWDYLTEEE